MTEDDWDDPDYAIMRQCYEWLERHDLQYHRDYYHGMLLGTATGWQNIGCDRLWFADIDHAAAYHLTWSGRLYADYPAFEPYA
ncbi:hypothetical protein [Sphingomonas faeni]|nr:hypothetical protein [Sphingomonas faeni]